MENIKEIEHHLKQGINYKHYKEYQSAISEFRTVLDLDANHAIAHMELGWLSYGYSNNFIEAKEHLFKALEADNSLSDAHMYIGIVLNRLENKIEAREHFLKSIELSDNPALSHATFAEEFLWHNSYYGEAEKHFKIAIKEDPECILAIRDYARMLACHGRDEEAEVLFKKAISLDSNDKYTIKNYLEFENERKDKDRDPIECLRSAINKDPNYSEGIKILNILLQNGIK